MTAIVLAIELAEAAEKLTAALRPTVWSPAFASPADGYEVVAELRETVDQLAATCRNLMVGSLQLADDDRLSHDVHGHGPEAAAEAVRAAEALRSAQHALNAAYGALDQAQNAYASLSLREVAE